MSPIPLGILAASGAGGPSDFQLISTQIVGTAAATVTFSSIPQTFKHLQIRMVAIGSGGFAYINSSLRLNGDTGANYSYHFLRSNGLSVSSSNSWPATGGFYIAPGSSDYNSTRMLSPQIIDILDYSQTTKNKTARTIGGFHDYSNKIVDLVSGNWRSTAAINTIAITAIASTYKTGSRFSLYGWN